MNQIETRNRLRSGSATVVPKFVDNRELHGRSAYGRLFGPDGVADATAEPGNGTEARCFKRMHFCARRMKALTRKYGNVATRRRDYKRFAELHKQLCDDIASANLGLVYDLYKRSRILNVDGDELLSEGMMALTRAIYTFDPWRGFRFSTYACNAIVRAFYRCGLKASRRREREPVTFDSDMEKSHWIETRRDDESGLYAERLVKLLEEDAVDLTAIERDVLAKRFPLDRGVARRTLSAIGREMRLSKERVRQIQNSALGKLREAIDLDPVLQ